MRQAPYPLEYDQFYSYWSAEKYFFVSDTITGVSMIKPMRFGIAINPFNASEIFHTMLNFATAPIPTKMTKTILYGKTDLMPKRYSIDFSP